MVARTLADTDPHELPRKRWGEAMAQRLQERLQATALEVMDESAQHAGHAGAAAEGWGSHFRVRIASPLFSGLTRVQRHQLVYDSVQDFLDCGVHALAIELIF